jgi:putative ABC transport system permease protein
MLRNYLKIAVKVLLRRKFYTAVSLFGIAFTLLVLVFGTAVLDEFLFSAYPETRRGRTLGIYRAKLVGPNGSRMSDAGYALLDRYARDLPGVEHFSVVSTPSQVTSFVDGDKVESTLRRTDAVFWEIMEFDFVEGGAFAAQDESMGNFVAVINEATRERFFGEGPATGRELRAGGQVFTVVGVVRDVPRTRMHSYAEIWVPIATAKSTSYRSDLIGGFTGIILAESRSRFADIKAEFDRRIAAADLSEEPEWETLVCAAHTLLEESFANFEAGPVESASMRAAMKIAGGVLVAILFMSLPALNLINLNLSRILERASEIGVRKAFGASSRTLVGQFLVESVLLTLVGGLLGLIAAEVLMAVVNDTGIVPYANVHVNYRVFVAGLVLSVFFGVFSGAYPAWRMSRMHPVEAIRGRM